MNQPKKEIPIQELPHHLNETLNYEYRDDEGKGESGIINLRKATPSYVFGFVKMRNSFVEFLGVKNVKFFLGDENRSL